MDLPRRVLAFDGPYLYMQEGGHLILADAMSGDHKSSWKLPFAGWQHNSKLLVRLRRLGVQSFTPLSGNKAVIIEDRIIYRLDLESGQVEARFEGFRGKRPLFLCQSVHGDLYFGEYFNNPDRDPVRIFLSRDQGLTFELVYTFPENSIRHVHGIFSDRLTSDLWITTGDENHESWIWKTDDGFRTLEPVIGGDQQCRAVQLLFKGDFIYYGSDSPRERNHLYRLDRKTGSVEKLQEVQGSVFFGANAGNALFFSTVVEPSSVNQDQEVYLWGSRDGIEWQVLRHFTKDPLPMKLFQYGQIRFPAGENQSGKLWFTPFATAKDQTAQNADLEQLF